MRFLKISVALFLTGSQLVLASLKDEKECKALAEVAMSFIGTEKYEEAFASMSKHWPIPEEEVVTLVKLTQTQMEAVSKRFGAVLGAEFIREDKLGESYLRYTFIQKSEKNATRWRFVFYRPKDTWLVNSVKWDDSTDLLFDLP